MNDLMNVVDWSRYQFALTAIYHWLFVPLTLGLSVMVAIMETIWYRTGNRQWLEITKFWMKLFGINFAMGVATGIILEFEFGTNWSNYSWFVGDIFGAPLAIEGLFAFFLEATFVAVMFFGWDRVSKKFHLTATWLTALGATLSAWWILVANGWMQSPQGMEFDPAQMRNVMVSFRDVALNPAAVSKFLHSVFSSWVLAAVFVMGTACWLKLRKRESSFIRRSFKVASAFGFAGILMTLFSGDMEGRTVTKAQPMKLAAMEGLYRGNVQQSFTAVGIINPDKKPGDDKDPYLFSVEVPGVLSLLANHDVNTFVPGIDDVIAGRTVTAKGDTIYGESYADRIASGKIAHRALADYDRASAAGDSNAMTAASDTLKAHFDDFGFGYFNSPDEIVPPVAPVFYTFHVMALLGGWLLLFFVVAVIGSYWRPTYFNHKWVLWLGILTVPLVWICSECGWITAEVGRQPWIVQDAMPTKAAISYISASSVKLTFWIFAAIFTLFLAAEATIMCKVIRKKQIDLLAFGDDTKAAEEAKTTEEADKY